MQPHPDAPILCEDILDLHADDRADAGEGINHETNQRLVAQIDVRFAIDAIEQRPHFRCIEHGRLALAHDMLRPAHGSSRIYLHHLTRHQPVEEMADGSQAQLDRRHRHSALQLLDPGRHMQRLHLSERAEPAILALGHALDTVEAAFRNCADTVRAALELPLQDVIVCGVTIGYADPDAVENTLQTTRAAARES